MKLSFKLDKFDGDSLDVSFEGDGKPLEDLLLLVKVIAEQLSSSGAKVEHRSVMIDSQESLDIFKAIAGIDPPEPVQAPGPKPSGGSS